MARKKKNVGEVARREKSRRVFYFFVGNLGAKSRRFMRHG
jgi:hypothetical protein